MEFWVDYSFLSAQNVVPFLLASLVSDEKCTAVEYLILLYATCCFCLAAFKFFFDFSAVWL